MATAEPRNRYGYVCCSCGKTCTGVMELHEHEKTCPKRHSHKRAPIVKLSQGKAQTSLEVTTCSPRASLLAAHAQPSVFLRP